MRIVSLVPSITETLADLGLDAEVVGVTRFCVHPPHWMRTRTIVGGTKDLLPERIEALRPDLILANREENVREQVEPLEVLATVYLNDTSTVDQGIGMIREIGELVGRSAKADVLADEIAVAFDRLERSIGEVTIPAGYLIWRAPYMTVGGDTFISDVMARTGLPNVFGDRARYPAVTPAEMSDSGARVMLLSSEPYPFVEAHAVELARDLPHLPIELVDGQMFSWYGSRMRHVPDYLIDLSRHLLRRVV